MIKLDAINNRILQELTRDGRVSNAELAERVGLSDHTRASQKTFEESIVTSPEVRECHKITGAFEYLLRVEAADLSAYKIFHTEVLGTLPRVNSITTYVVMESAKDERG